MTQMNVEFKRAFQENWRIKAEWKTGKNKIKRTCRQLQKRQNGEINEMCLVLLVCSESINGPGRAERVEERSLYFCQQ